jgi:predicted dehydrogenase
MIRVAVVGAGYWGPNLIRNFAVCPSTKLVAICDQDAGRLQKFRGQYPEVHLLTALDELLGMADLDAVAIATPVHTHHPLARAALQAGKHVLIEKPLAASVSQAEELVRLARERGRVLMVDHTFLFSPAVQRIKSLIEAGTVGEVYFIDSVRINLGLFQHDVNVIWDLAPHDLSIVQYVLNAAPVSVAAIGACHVATRVRMEDLAYVNLDYGKGLLATFHVSWLSPVKVRQFIVGGSSKSIVYNDLESAEKLKVYDRGLVLASEDQRHRAQINYRTGDIWSPHLEQVEPLQLMVQHFAQCVQSGVRPITDGEFGLQIVRVLEAAQASLRSGGARVRLAAEAPHLPSVHARAA